MAPSFLWHQTLLLWVPVPQDVEQDPYDPVAHAYVYVTEHELYAAGAGDHDPLLQVDETAEGQEEGYVTELAEYVVQFAPFPAAEQPPDATQPQELTVTPAGRLL